MTQIELYINKQLCDIQSPEKLGVRLNRILINPTELNTKDAQYSYSITLPSTPANDAIFGYAAVEEIKNKFNTDYSAMLLVDGVTVFNGKFRMSEITSVHYKGNLLIPQKKTIKELFDDKKMSEAGTWKIDFKNLVDSFNHYNKRRDIPECIFPFVLYGLMPKLSMKLPDKLTETYTEKDVWDAYVRFGIQDFPPSINTMQAISRIFNQKGYRIEGSAFDDKRLTNLYMSYQNPTNYEQEWNWGHLSKMRIRGSWRNYDAYKETTIPKEDKSNYVQNYERLFYRNENGRSVYAANLFDSTTTNFSEILDYGTNTVYERTPYEENGEKTQRSTLRVTIPFSGYYKIKLSTKLVLDGENNNSRWSRKCKFVSGGYSNAKNNLDHRAYEIKLIRDFATADFKMGSATMDGRFYEPNMPQKRMAPDYTDDGILENPEAFPQLYPVPGPQCVQFVDPSQNEQLLSGFHFGREQVDEDAHPYEDVIVDQQKLKDTDGNSINKDSLDYLGCRILAVKSGWSHDVKFSQKEKIYSAVRNITRLPKKHTVKSEANAIGDTVIENEKVVWDENRGYVYYGQSPATSSAAVDDTNKIGWFNSDVFKVDLHGAENNVRKLKEALTYSGGYRGPESVDAWNAGEGVLHQVVWLNKGEAITLIAVSDRGIARERQKGTEGWVIQHIDFDLEMEACHKEQTWLKMSDNNSSIEPINWNIPDTEKTLLTDQIDLMKFLPSETKVDEWLDNFCKAFNLQLIQTGEKKFQLNVKQLHQQNASGILDLSDKANVLHRTNLPLDLPAVYELGFKINEEEKGYVDSLDNGGGRIETGTIDGSTLSQTSNFSYNWFKKIRKDGRILSVPVITHKEIWEGHILNYPEMMKKLYTNYGQRFWYRTEEIESLGVIWDGQNNKDNPENRHLEIFVPVLSSSYSDSSTLHLHYKNMPDSILRNYFKVIASNDSNYTEVECFLSPDEYERLNGSTMVKLYDDLYYVASVEGYDPLNGSKTKLKLIRKVK